MRTSDKSAEWARLKRHAAIRKPGELIIRHEPIVKSKGRKGNNVNRFTRQKRMPGDKMLVFGREPKHPSFVGGEGGRGWSVPSTIC